MPNSPYDLSDRVCDFAQPTQSTLTFQETNRLLDRAERAEAKVRKLESTHKDDLDELERLAQELEQADKSLAKMLADMPTPNQRKAIKAMLDNPEQFCADAQWWCDLLNDDQSRLSAESAKENNDTTEL